VPVNRELLRRLSGAMRPYPLKWVDRSLFAGKRWPVDEPEATEQSDPGAVE
jgi:hypothetical protein